MSLIKFNYMGCGCCPFSTTEDCKNSETNVKLTFKNPEYADCWGRFIRVFDANETVKGTAHIKDGIVYCATAESVNYSDFVDLNNVAVTIK